MNPKPSLFRTCLTASAVGLLALASALPARADYASTVSSYNPSAYWRLNETTPVPVDIATNIGTIGAAGNGACYGVLHGVAGISGGGTDAAATILNNPANNAGMRRIRVPFSSALAPSGPFTAEFWCKPATGGNPSSLGGTPLSFVDFGGTRGWLFYQGASVAGAWTFRVYNGSGSVSVTTGTITAGQWHHVVGVYDGTKMYLYVDNVLLGQNNVTYAPVTNPNIPLSMGTRADGASGWFGYSGDLDEVALYTNVLSPTDIANHYNAGSNTGTPDYSVVVTTNNPIGYWRLNEPAPALPVAVNSGSLSTGAQGTYQPWMTNGVTGPGYPGLGGATVAAFNGIAGYIDCGKNVPDLSAPLSSMTIMTWAKFSATRTMDWESIITCGDTAWELQRPNNDYGVNFRFAGKDVNTPSTRPINDGNWHHIAATYDGAQQKVYIDGTLAASANLTGSNAGETAYPILIGDNGQWPGRVFKGSLAEMAVFTTALSATDIQTIYNAGQQSPIITIQPQGPTGVVYEGDSVSLSAQAAGVAPLSYQWTKNGAAISGATTTSLALSNLTTSTSGNYALVVTNSYGSVTSSVVALSVQVSPPTITAQPVSLMRFVNSPATFSVGVRGSLPMAFQWKRGGSPIAGATTSSLVLTNVQWSDFGSSFSCTISNLYGTTNTVAVTLTVRGEFASLTLPDTGSRDRHTALGSDGAHLYFTLGHGPNAGFYQMAEGVSGSWTTLQSIPLSSVNDNDSGVGDLSYFGGALYMLARAADSPSARCVYQYDVTANNWTKGNTFLKTDGTATDGPNTAAAVIDANHILGAWVGLGTAATIKQITNWQSGQLGADVGDAGGAFAHPYDACVGDKVYYVKHNYNSASGPGVLVSINKTGTPTITTIAGMPFNPGMGCAVEFLPGSLFSDTHNRLFVLRGGTGSGANDGSGWTTAAMADQLAVYDLSTAQWDLQTLPFAVDGGSEMCLVNKTLYVLAANSDLQPLKVLYLGPTLSPTITSQPMAQTNYAGQSATFSATAYGGGPYTYQWRRDGVAIPGATGSSLTLGASSFGDIGNYDVLIANSAGQVYSQQVGLTVLPQPTFANLTNGLVIHLKFDTNNLAADPQAGYRDSSGNMNDATPYGAPTFVPGKLGAGIELSTVTGSGIYNYLQVYDLNNQFEFPTTASFSLALWLKYTNDFNDLPIIGNAINSTYQKGYVLCEDHNQFEWTSVGEDTGSVIADPVGGPVLNDGAWHQLTVVFDRSQQLAQSYVDGVLIDTRSIAGVGNLVTGNPLTLGQDPSGTYGVNGTFDVDDVGLWTRALAPLEAQAIYLVGQNYGRSFDTIAPITLNLQKSGNGLRLIWQAGTLQSADSLNGPWSPVPGAAAPYYQLTPAAAKKFFRVE